MTRSRAALVLSGCKVTWLFSFATRVVLISAPAARAILGAAGDPVSVEEGGSFEALVRTETGEYLQHRLVCFELVPVRGSPERLQGLFHGILIKLGLDEQAPEVPLCTTHFSAQGHDPSCMLFKQGAQLLPRRFLKVAENPAKIWREMSDRWPIEYAPANEQAHSQQINPQRDQ